MRHLPDWFPGAAFKRKAKYWKKCLWEMVNETYEFVLEELAAGKPNHSFAAKCITEKGDDDARLVAASLMAGEHNIALLGY